MADINHGVDPQFLGEEELNQGMELLFYGYRDFTADSDAALARNGFGRAHYRVLYFVGRNPGIAVRQLLDILKITKQSLSRVLSFLVAEGYIEQRQGTRDRRKRHLTLTEKGGMLERQFSARQRARIGDAYRQAGAEAVEGFRKVMTGMVNEQDRRRFSRRP